MQERMTGMFTMMVKGNPWSLALYVDAWDIKGQGQ